MAARKLPTRSVWQLRLPYSTQCPLATRAGCALLTWMQTSLALVRTAMTVQEGALLTLMQTSRALVRTAMTVHKGMPTLRTSWTGVCKC